MAAASALIFVASACSAERFSTSSTPTTSGICRTSRISIDDLLRRLLKASAVRATSLTLGSSIVSKKRSMLADAIVNSYGSGNRTGRLAVMPFWVTVAGAVRKTV